MDANRRNWNHDHTALQALLRKPGNYSRALPLLLGHHAAVHSSKLRAGAAWSIQEEALAPLDEDRLRCIPARGMPALWAIWHITRVEDATIHTLLAGKDQVFDAGDWQQRIGVRIRDVGNDLPAAELARFCRSADLDALLAYRLAVGRRTRAIFRRLDPEILQELPNPANLRLLRLARIVRPKAVWLYEYWGGHPAGNLLLMPATRHPFVHWNEICRSTPKTRDSGR